MKKDFEIDDDNLNIEIELLLEAIFQKYSYDFRNYGRAHIKRRILHRLASSNFENVSHLQHQILYDESLLKLILKDFSINVTEMFRDPSFYRKLKTEVIPILKTYPFIKIWHAGCSTGEEVYSMAILLHEEGLLERSQIYATDFNQTVLKKASEGIYHINKVKEFTFNYQKSGGTQSFSDYYTAKFESVILNKELKSNITFADHNLVCDNSFAEVHLVICRNVLIYFNKKLQNSVIKLLSNSLIPGGYLALGSKESLRFSSSFYDFDIIDENEKIYKKILSINPNK